MKTGPRDMCQSLSVQLYNTDIFMWDLLLEADYKGCQGARVGGQEAEWVPLHVPESSFFDRHWSHWPCSSLSQGQYSPSTEGGVRHPQAQQQVSHGINREKREEQELSSIARQ